jgi:Glycosyl hydrolase family 71
MSSANANAWPFVQPTLSTLRASSKKVFAHYFTPFPLSMDNLPSPFDYYSTQYMSPMGEDGKFAGSGGFIKQRPLPRNAITTANWDGTDVVQDLRRAASLGIDGFAVDLLATTGVHWARAKRVLDTAATEDAGFKILLMPDMEAEFKTQPSNLLYAVRALASHPSSYRLDDGRLVLAPYNAQNQSVAWWTEQLATLRAEGIAIAFFPVFQGWSQFGAEFVPISHGQSDWGDRSPGANKNWLNVPARAHAYGVQWMSTVSPQDARAKDLIFWEARNSENYRVMWETAIAGNADWVHIVTWNDYSEGTEVAPSTGTQWSFYDLTAYYTAWFKTGARPATNRDVIFYFHRKHSSTAPPQAGKQTRPYVLGGGSDAAADDVEVVAFATAPSLLVITQGSKLLEYPLLVGLNTVRVPLFEGIPSFEIRRNNKTVTSVRSGFAISNTITYQDMLYRSGSSARVLIAPQ